MVAPQGISTDKYFFNSSNKTIIADKKINKIPVKKQLIKTIQLQLFFIALAFFNFFYGLFFLRWMRYLMLRITGNKIGKKSCIQKVKFFTFGKLKVGNNTIINSGCYLDARRGIEIGSNVILAHNTKIYTLGHDYNDKTFATKGKPVIIKDYAVVFANVLIMPGVTINEGAVVLPGSVVSKDVASMTVVGGNPAKVIRQREVLHTDKNAFRYWFSI